MQTRFFALTSGIIFFLLGILGFVTFFVSVPPADAPAMAIKSAFGELFGIFPVNSLMNVVHTLWGLIGIIAYTNLSSSQTYARWSGYGAGLLAILGMLPFARTLGGLLPLYSHNIWLHGVMAIFSTLYASPRVREKLGMKSTEEKADQLASARRSTQERKPKDLDKAG
jgi:multidrug transporter EmrE-like cation transporter